MPHLFAESQDDRGQRFVKTDFFNDSIMMIDNLVMSELLFSGYKKTLNDFLEIWNLTGV
jgi:hypothetical protein